MNTSNDLTVNEVVELINRLSRAIGYQCYICLDSTGRGKIVNGDDETIGMFWTDLKGEVTGLQSYMEYLIEYYEKELSDSLNNT